MLAEAREAPQVVANQLPANAAFCAEFARRLARRPPRLVATCARGSSDHAATYAKYLIETLLGLPVMSAAPSVGSLYAARVDLRDTLFVVLSQSGASPDLVANAHWARRNGAQVLAVVNATDSPLAAAADAVLALRAGPECSVAATKSWIASLSALLQLVAAVAGARALEAALQALPAHLERALALDWDSALPVLAGVEDLLVVGRGYGFALAGEAALKLKETAGLHAEAFSGAELEHGPLALVQEGFPVLVFTQADATLATLRQLIEKLRARGVRVVVAESGPPAPGRLPVVPGMHALTAPIALAQRFYVLAHSIALARGRDPDRPPLLSKVTATR